ncbi:MAG: gamma-glutamyl-gamma-aminobutyrate hydrolase family protein [Alphaproteobacteria bacterium]|nr:gamma-glutamyl-gamma-aminobutyrate hydrolase family protein [Alphaproteobacteria bacterium]
MKSSVIIGISGRDSVSASVRAMAKKIEENNAAALVICEHNGRQPEEDFRCIDGLVVMGNDSDINPRKYIHRYPEGHPNRRVHPATQCESRCPHSTARADYEEAMLSMALTARMPILGICGGMQRLNVLCGGTLHQHLPDIVGHNKLAQQEHGIDPATAVVPILIEGGTALAGIAADIPMPFTTSHCSARPKVIMENSMHHQVIDMVAPDLKACALSDAIPLPGGAARFIVEAVEAHPQGVYKDQFILGVQWHPEFSASPIGVRIARHLIRQAAAFAAAKACDG